ncbi:MAG: hypothetical protein IPM92_06290 [Saprospiraceae bacterium]|nr:hypothetical protein [Saprospiraceae bacterium]
MKLKVEPDLSQESEIAFSNADFYEEEGKIVFTETYHLKRGYCCQSGCRHCPYSK